MLKSEVLKFFPEPVFKYKFEKAEFFNQELAQYIYNLQKEDLNGLTKSNRGGWHSKDFKLSDQNSIQFKFALELQKYIFDTFEKFFEQYMNARAFVKKNFRDSTSINNRGKYFKIFKLSIFILDSFSFFSSFSKISSIFLSRGLGVILFNLLYSNCFFLL